MNIRSYIIAQWPSKSWEGGRGRGRERGKEIEDVMYFTSKCIQIEWAENYIITDRHYINFETRT